MHKKANYWFFIRNKRHADDDVVGQVFKEITASRQSHANIFREMEYHKLSEVVKESPLVLTPEM